MKKFLTILLALTLALSLAACGGKKEEPAPAEKPGSDAPLTREDPSAEQGGSAEPATPSDPAETLAGAIAEGTGDVIYGKLDDQQKQELIKQGEEDGVKVEFRPDGSTVFTEEDGGVTVQNPDGSWRYTDEEDGSVTELGGGWPDNEYTRQIPKPPFELTAANIEGEGFTAIFNADAEQIRAYAEELKDAGFTVDPVTEEEEVMGMAMYSYTAKNAAGYTAEVFSNTGVNGLTIYK